MSPDTSLRVNTARVTSVTSPSGEFEHINILPCTVCFLAAESSVFLCFICTVCLHANRVELCPTCSLVQNKQTNKQKCMHAALNAPKVLIWKLWNIVRKKKEKKKKSVHLNKRGDFSIFKLFFVLFFFVMPLASEPDFYRRMIPYNIANLRLFIVTFPVYVITRVHKGSTSRTCCINKVTPAFRKHKTTD